MSKPTASEKPSAWALGLLFACSLFAAIAIVLVSMGPL